MLKAIIIGVVGTSSRRPWLVLAISLAIAVFAASYVARHFAINTDINKLLSDRLPWRQREIAFSKAFPTQESSILAVVDAPTPELAEQSAQRLTESLNQQKDHIRSARLLTSSDFFRRNGLLYLSVDELKSTLDDLSKSAPLLGRISADPSLKGFLDTISLSLRGVQFHRVSLESLSPEFNALSDTIEDALAGRPVSFSWRALLSGEKPSPSQLRQLVEVIPTLDFQDLEPGAKASSTIRQTAADLGLSAEGVRVRLTGSVAISDEEFGTLKEGAAWNTTLTVLAVLIILWLALHSMRIIFSVFVSLIVGLSVTAALGLAMVGAFNPISVAFFVLFVGIGVDFGLQFSVAYRHERYERQDLLRSLVATASSVGGRLALAALATAAGFLSFLPTAYRGLSELGEIAGFGMLIAFVTSITVLPALLALLNTPAESDPLGYGFLAPLDRFLERKRMWVLVGTLVTVTAAAPLLFWLRFDFNPMNLRNPKAESVATYLDLRKSPELRGGSAEVLAPSLDQANAIAKKLAALPEVARVQTLSSFVPEGQDEKLALIQNAAKQVGEQLAPKEAPPAPSDEDTVSSIESASKALAAIATSRAGQPGADAAQRLADALSKLGKASAAVREKVQAALLSSFRFTLDGLRASLNPERVTLENLPPSLASDWRTADGRARVSIFSKGDTNNNDVLRTFANAVLAAEPNATGEVVGIEKASGTIVHAFEVAAGWALVSIALLLWAFLRRFTDVLLTLIPLLLAGVVTLELCVALGLKLNFANIIALPVLLGVGVAFKIYYVMAWREGRSGLLASPLTRAVFYSGLTTAVAFGSLWVSNHPGTSSMGQLLALALVSTMAAAVLFQPLLMGPPRVNNQNNKEAVSELSSHCEEL